MAAIDDLLALALQIKTETVEDNNSADRIGSALDQIIKYFRDTVTTPTTTAISEAIAALKDSPPSTLDTLNKIAAALNDDPDFHININNIISAKVAKTQVKTVTGTSATDLMSQKAITDELVKKVSIEAQTLTDPQKAQARTNIGAQPVNDGALNTTDKTIAGAINELKVVKIDFNPQILTEGQQTQARTNINAVGKSGNETIGGVKTFSLSPVVPAATNDTDSQNKAGVELQITARQESARSQSTTKSPTSKLMDDEISKIAASVVSSANQIIKNTASIGAISNMDETYLIPKLYPDATYPDKVFENGISPELWIYDLRNFFYGSDSIDFYFNIREASGASVKFFQLSGTDVTVLHTHIVSGSTGNIKVLLSDISYDFNSTVGKIYIAISSVNYSRGASYNDLTNAFSGYFTNSLVATADNFDVGMWIAKMELSPIVLNVKSLIGEGVFDIASEIALKPVIFIPEGTHTISSTISILSNRKIYGIPGKSIIRPAIGVTKVFEIISKSDVTLSDFVLFGNDDDIDTTDTDKINSNADIVSENGAGTNIGIQVQSSSRVLIDNVEIKNFDKYGLITTYIGQSFMNGSKFTNITIHDCYVGWKCDVRSEYSMGIGVTINKCLVGLSVVSGNMIFSGCSFTSNRVGVYLGAGDNDSHGTMAACLINHNKFVGLLAYGISNGYTFSSCHFYEGGIDIVNSMGVTILGCIIDANVKITGGLAAKSNIISSTCFFTSYVIGDIITITDNTVTLLKNNYRANGAIDLNINN